MWFQVQQYIYKSCLELALGAGLAPSYLPLQVLAILDLMKMGVVCGFLSFRVGPRVLL